MFRRRIRHLTNNLGTKISKMCKIIPVARDDQRAIAIFLTVFWMLLTTQYQFLSGQEISVSIEPDSIHDVNLQVDCDGAVVVFTQGDHEEQDRETVLPLEVRARLTYEQQSVVSSQQALRFYRKASAKISIDGKSHELGLEKANQTVNTFLAGGQSLTKPVLFSSELDILKQSELELITSPFDFLTLPDFFSKDRTELNQPWQPSDQDVVNVLAINRLYTNDVQLTVKEYSDREIKIYVTGRATGEVDGEDVSVELRGVALIDNRKNFVKSLRVNINETRRAGQIAPGFEGIVKLDMKVKSKDNSELIPPPAISRARKFRQQKLAWKPSNTFMIYFDPRWRLITDEDQAAVFRLLDDGDLLAQCNVVQLPSRPRNNFLELKEFQEEVAKIIDDSPARVIGSYKRETARGLKVLQVEVLGEEEEVSIRWVYNHVAHEDGRQLTFVFTVEDEVYDQFTKFGHSLIDSVIFKDQKQESTAAKSSNEKKR